LLLLNLVVQEPFPGVRDGRKIDSGKTAKGRGEMEGGKRGRESGLGAVIG
jgi:hypothetical protein